MLPADLTLGTGSTIGRYFSLVSVVPSVLLATWLWLAWASGAVTAQPSLAAIAHETSDNAIGSGLIVAGLAVASALILHPLQFAIVQLLEGYWGSTRLGRFFQVRRQVAHLYRYGRATREQERQNESIATWVQSGVDVDMQLLESTTARRTELMTTLAAASAAADQIVTFPDSPQQIMATRLGNVLRRAEMRAGRSYGLPILMSATHLGMVADATHTAYVQDQRTQLDLTARICASGVFAAAVTTAIMWPHGLWLLSALIPYTAAYLAYRGAITAGTSYGQALSAWSDLNRFALYTALHLRTPMSASDEQQQNAAVRDLLVHVANFTADYDSPAAKGDVPTANNAEPT